MAYRRKRKSSRRKSSAKSLARKVVRALRIGYRL